MSDATLPEVTTDCCVANTIVNCYYWSFEVADVVAKGRVREKDKENVVKGHEVKTRSNKDMVKDWSMAKMNN